MNELKGSYQPLLAFAVLAVAGQLVKPVQDALLGLFAKKATAVMTNVPGPARAAEVLRLDAAPDDVLGAGVGRHRRRRVSILSYGGGVQFGLITDEALCPDPQAIVDRFEPEFDKLLLADDDAALEPPGG